MHFPSSRLTTFSALSNPHYRLYYIAQLASNAAVLMLTLARGWLVYDMTNSPFLLGVVSGAFSIPVVVLALPGGAIADRVNKRKLIIFTESVAAFLSLSIALLIFTKQISVWHLILASFLSGTSFSFGQPAKQVIINDLVGQDKLMNAIALNSAGFNSMRIIAPASGGFLLAFTGMAPVYLLGSSLTMLGVVLLLTLPKGVGNPEQLPGRFGTEVLEGIKYLWRDKIIFTMMLVTFLPTLLAVPYQYMLPIFARDVLQVGEVGLGWMTAMPGIGAVTGTLIIASLGNYSSKGRLLLLFMTFQGVLLVLFAFSGAYVVSLLFLLMLGSCITGFNTVNNTLLQTYSSAEMRGRVMSIMTVAFGMAPLGAIPLGAAAQATSAPLALGGAGVIVVLAAVSLMTFHTSFRRLR